MNNRQLEFDINGIKACQQNRHPILFIDRVTECVPGKKATGIKNFSYNEWFFPSHYEDEPSVPGFIMVEAMVQSFIMTFLSIDEYKGSKTNFLNIENASFRRKVIPGECLIIKCELLSLRRGIARGTARAYVQKEFTCSADFTVSIRSVTDNIFKKMQEKNSVAHS